MHIAGSSAIVVGGTGGLGEATVRRLHGAGAKVVMAELADDKCRGLEREFGVRYVCTDATSEDSVNAAIGKDGSPLDFDGIEYAQLAQSIVENDDLIGEIIRLDGALRFPPK